MSEIDSPNTSPEPDLPLCPFCEDATERCEQEDCPIAEAALCQYCGAEHPVEAPCAMQRASLIRQASIDTPFTLGI